MISDYDLRFQELKKRFVGDHRIKSDYSGVQPLQDFSRNNLQAIALQGPEVNRFKTSTLRLDDLPNKRIIPSAPPDIQSVPL